MIRLAALLLLFFLSGAAGLLYQVVWTRLFVHTFGATVLAVSTVLAAFMAGLAAGGLWAGRASGRIRNPLRAYGFLEIALGVYAALVPLILRLVDPLYAHLYPGLEGSFGTLSALRFCVSALVLLPPTFLMGATLPLLVEHMERHGTAARRRVALLYAVNTFGAVAGTMASAFAMLPALGLMRTLAVGVGVSLLVGLAAVLLSRRGPDPARALAAAPPSGDPGSTPTDTPWIPRPLLLLSTAVLGFSALAFEVLWTRTLALALGTTTYAFAVVLAVFLLGIALGGLVAGRLLANPRRAVGFFVAAPGAVGLLALVLLPIFDKLPDLFMALSLRSGSGFLPNLLAKLVVAGTPMLLPTLVSGAAFPLAVGIDCSAGRAGRSAGDVYGANTLGAILGAWGAGFVLIPLVGLRGGIEFAALLPLLATCLLLLGRRPALRLAAVPALALAIAGASLLAFLPDWNRAALTRGGFAIETELRRSGRTKLAEDHTQLLFLEEGITTTVTVRRWRDEITMQMNGITEASNSGDIGTQVMVGGLAPLLHPDPKDVLVVGLGSGVTASAVARFVSVRTIDCVEIAEAVVHGARFFEDANRGVMKDPRFHLIVGDGRNHLRLSGKMYDCIVSEPSNVWSAGIAALMTEEFFRMCRDHLRPGGTMCSWIQGYSLSPDALRSVVAAARRSFPRVTVWSAGWGDLLVTAGDESFSLDAQRILDRAEDPAIRAMLLQTDSPDLVTLLSNVLLAGSALDRWVGDFPPNTDDNLYLEYEAPKLIHRDTMRALFESLDRAAGGAGELLRNAPEGLAAGLNRARQARTLESQARLAFRDEQGEAGLAATEEAFRLMPTSPSIRRLLSIALDSRGMAFANRGQGQEARNLYLRAADLDPDAGDPFANLAKLYRDAGQMSQAFEAVAEALRRQPRQPEFLALAAELSNRARRWEDGKSAAEAALAIDGSLHDGFVALGDALAGLHAPAEAESVLVRGLAVHPDSPDLAKRLERVRRAEASPGAP